jgi:hypothetical protein
VVLAALAAVVAAPANASATSGAVTKALASPSWTSATIAGSATWTGCHLQPPKSPEEPKPPKEEGEEEVGAPDSPPPRCGWTPFATVGPGTQASECSSAARLWPEALGPGVTLAWQGSEGESEGTASFEVSGVPLDGSAGQLVCLGLIETASAFPWHARASLFLASAVLTKEAPKPKRCSCPPRRRHHHVKHRRHRHIFVSQHQKVPKA